MKVKKLHGHGNHLMLDGYSRSDLEDVDFIKQVLIEIPNEIGMKAISEPMVLYHEANDDSESGVTGTIILAESNITIHTYPKSKWFCLDVFSCNEFEKEKVVKYLIGKLKIFGYHDKMIKRGFYDERG